MSTRDKLADHKNNNNKLPILDLQCSAIEALSAGFFRDGRTT